MVKVLEELEKLNMIMDDYTRVKLLNMFIGTLNSSRGMFIFVEKA